MKLYAFLEEILRRGGRIEDIELIQSADKGIGEATLKQTIRLLEGYTSKSEEERAAYSGNRRFGFDKGSYIGELLVVSIGRKPALIDNTTVVTLTVPAIDWT